MKIISPYTSPQRWLKGNLHTHTTLSDGDASYDEVVSAYANDNYDFLSITDHRKVSPAGTRGDMLLLPGQECHVVDPDNTFSYHVVAIGDLGDEGAIPELADGQAIINEINRRGALAIVAHPRWSFMPYELFNELHGYAAFEVYNGFCDFECGRGISSDYWDFYMRRCKKPIWGLGTDDAHYYMRNLAQGWTFVNAEKNPESIYDAIKRGDFYATGGPRIETINVTDESITLHTSAARMVKWLDQSAAIREITAASHLKIASYSPVGDELYIRAEVHGHDGRIAWTNPFFIENDEAGTAQ